MTKHSTDAVESFYGIDVIVIITMDNDIVCICGSDFIMSLVQLNVVL